MFVNALQDRSNLITPTFCFSINGKHIGNGSFRRRITWLALIIRGALKLFCCRGFAEFPNFSGGMWTESIWCVLREKTMFWGRGVSWGGTYFQCPLEARHLTDLWQRLCERHHRTLGLVWLPWSEQRDGCVLEHLVVTLGLLTCPAGLHRAGCLYCPPSQTTSPFLKQRLSAMNSAVRI